MKSFSALAIVLAYSGLATATSFSTECDADGNCAGKEHEHFDALLDSTLMTYGLHKINHTSHGKQSELPIPEKLFMAGAGAGSGGSLKKAKEMKKMPNQNVWTITDTIRSGGIVFIPSKDTWKGAFATNAASIVREDQFCTLCGLDANLTLKDDEGSIDVPGPTKKGKFKVVVNLDDGTISYTCAAKCWPHKNTKYTHLYAVGPSICGDDYKEKKGPELQRADGEDSQLFYGKLHMCPGKGFKVYPYLGKGKDDIGLWDTSYVDEAGSHLAHDGHGHLRQWQDDRIPGPLIEAWYNFSIDLTTGTFDLHCVDMCDGPRMTNYSRFEATNPPGPGDAFVHLFSWKWDDVATECEQFLGPKGVKGVQIQPPQESKVPKPNRADSWNYVYRPVSYRLDSRLGTEAQLKSMIERCKAAGVDVYFDAVVNHMAGGGGIGSSGSAIQKRKFPAAGYLPEDFHHTTDLLTNCRTGVGGDKNCDEECEQKCDFNGMPDLDTSSPKVQGKLRDYLNSVLDLGAAGFRIDASDHISEHDLSEILSGVYPKWRFQETHHWEPLLPTGAVTQFKYRFQLMQAITGSDLTEIQIIGEASGLAPSQDAVVMIVNHDIAMNEDQHGFGIIYKQPNLYTLGHVTMLAHPYGYPKVMSSYYFPHGEPTAPPPAENVHGQNGELRCGDGVNWVCEHRWPAIANMFRWRSVAGNGTMTHFTLDPEDPAHAYFCRGDAACIFLNAGKEPWPVKPEKLPVPAGTYCNIIDSDDPLHCSTVKVANGTTTSEIVVPEVGAVAFHIRAMGPDA